MPSFCLIYLVAFFSDAFEIVAEVDATFTLFSFFSQCVKIIYKLHLAFAFISVKCRHPLRS
jgi:hypothetical protein